MVSTDISEYYLPAVDITAQDGEINTGNRLDLGTFRFFDVPQKMITGHQLLIKSSIRIKNISYKVTSFLSHVVLV